MSSREASQTMKDSMFTTRLQTLDMVLADQHSGEVDGLSQGKHEDISKKKPLTVRSR